MSIQLTHRSNEVPTPLLGTSPPSSSKTISIQLPTLFLHGLDSSSRTWERVLANLGEGYPGAAVDLRGCGGSDLGDPAEFSPDAIVEDLFRFVTDHPMFLPSGGKFVVVGHSMGGRIAMSFAAKYPQHVGALIIEDMDIKKRPMSMNMIRSPNSREETINFDRMIRSTTNNAKTTESDVIRAFEHVGYPKEMVDRWLCDDGRISWIKEDGCDDDGDNGYYYSDVNPAFRQLCYEQFFTTNHGEETWKTLAEICAGTTGGGGDDDDTGEVGTISAGGFPCHVMVAGDDGTVCDEASIGRMKEIFGRSFNSILHRYPRANHSIHNSDQETYISDLKEIIRTASLSS